jgi:hypothetical protein
MIYKYVYKNRKTGERIYTNEKKDEKRFELLQEVKGIEFDFENLKQKKC